MPTTGDDGVVIGLPAAAGGGKAKAELDPPRTKTWWPLLTLLPLPCRVRSNGLLRAKCRVMAGEETGVLWLGGGGMRVGVPHVGVAGELGVPDAEETAEEDML